MRVPTRTLCSALLVALAACGEVGGAARPNVILICLDTVRADHLGCYGYERRETTPRLDALARESTLFADASAAACWTKPSVPSFLTGTYPLQHGVYEGSSKDIQGEISHVLPQSSVTLAEAFQAAGWSTAAFVRNAQLRHGLGFEQGFELYQDEAGDAREIRWRAQDWLDAREDDRPFFLYLHLLDAHWPWPVPDEYAARFAPLEDVEPLRGRGSRALRDAVNDGEHSLSEAEREAMLALYDGSLRFMDDQLGELFAWLERGDLWKDTIVCVVSDHGEEFGEHGRVGHGHGLYEGLLRVPWILRVPGRAPRVVDAPVSLIDLFPTLLSAAHLASPAEVQGLDRLAQPDRTALILAEHKEPQAYLQSLRSGSAKLVRRFEPLALAERAGGGPRLRAGRRYEVDLELLPGGELRAIEVQPSEDDPGEPPQLKGVVRELTGDRFELAGRPVRLAPLVELYGEVPAGAGKEVLSDGLLVKAVVTPVGEVFEARRVKVYAPDARSDHELRGDLVAFEGDAASGWLEMAGQRIAVDSATRWQDFESRAGGDLERENLVAWAAGGGAGYRVQRWLRDLAADPRELDEISEGGAAVAPLEHALDEMGAALAARRAWSAGDTQRLDAAALDELRALGYVR